MTKIVIVYHSGYGHTPKVAEAVASTAAAHAAGHRRRGQPARRRLGDSLAAAPMHRLRLARPTWARPSWQFKKFADASSKPWFSQVWKDKLAAGFTNSATLNGDKLSTLHYFITLSQQHGMVWVGTGMHAGQQPRPPRATTSTTSARRPA